MKKALIIILPLLALLSAKASAQATSDLGTWSSVQIIKSFGAPYAMARLEHRSFDKIRNTECWFAMVGGGYNFNKWLKGDLSYEFWHIPSAGNIMQHKAVLTLNETLKLNGLAVSLREKYELAYSTGTKSFSNTIRARLRGQYTPDGSIFTPYVMYELFGSFDNLKWVRSLHYAGTEINLGKGHSLDLYYMYHLFDNSKLQGYQSAACHIIGVGYFFVF